MKSYSIHFNRFVLLSAFFLFFGSALFAQSDSVRLFHIGIIYPVSSNGLKAKEYTNKFSIHAIAGLSKIETAVAVSGAANVILDRANGAMIAGAVNYVGDSARGAQIAGFANFIKGEGDGAQLGGFMNYTYSAKGAQVAGFANISKGDVEGAQVAGFLNKSKNVGNQISGFINIADQVKGVQVAGLINIANSSKYPIGLINIIKDGEKGISLSLDETLTTVATFRSGGKVLYGIVGIGYNLKDDGKSLYAVESGLGAHINIARQFRINTEVTNQFLSDFKKGEYSKYNLRILPAYRFGKFELFAGPTFNYVNYTKDKGTGLIKNYMWSKAGSRDFQGIYIGAVGGIQFIL